MGEIEKYGGRRLDGGNVIPVLPMGVLPGAVGLEYITRGFNLTDGRVHKFGSNPDVSSGDVPVDVWDEGDIYTGFLPTNAAIKCVSSSPDDDTGGAGARTYLATGVDANYQLISVVGSTNGVGASVFGNFLRVFRVVVLTSGNPTNTNVGTLTFSTEPGDVVVAQILPTIGQTLMSIYTVPSDWKKAWLTQMVLGLASANAVARTATAILQMRPFGGSWNTKESFQIHTHNSPVVIPYPMPIEIEPRTDMRVRITSVSTANSVVDATFDLFLEPRDD